MSGSRFGLPLLLCASPALAEVCDKVAGEDWRPVQGPVDVLTWQKSILILTAVAITACLVVILKWRRLAWTAAIVAGALTVLTVVRDVFPSFPGDGPFLQAAINEGCWSSNSTLNSVAFALFYAVTAASFIWLARGHPVIR